MQSELNNLKNVIIGFDLATSAVRIFRLNGTDQNSAVINDIKVDKGLFDRGEYGEALKTAINYYKKEIAEIQSAFVVFPDSLISSDYVQLPKMNKKKILEALQTELNKLYNNSVNLTKLNVEVDDAKDENALFFVTLANTTYINEISTGLAKASVQPRTFTYSAACSLNAALDRRSDLKNKDFVFVDVRPDSTILTACSGSTIRAYYDLPFGANVLRSDMIYPENALSSDNELAEELVQAAISKASGGKTVVAYPHVPVFDESGLTSAEKEKLTLDYYASLLPDAFKRSVEGMEELDILYANFGIFEKYIELFIQNNCTGGNVPSCDTVLVNLPEEFHFIKDCVGESAQKINYEFLDNRFKNKAYVTNLDLYGALFIKKFNSEQVI